MLASSRTSTRLGSLRLRFAIRSLNMRTVDVQADEAAFKKTQEAEQQQRARIKKVQENVDRM